MSEPIRVGAMTNSMSTEADETATAHSGPGVQASADPTDDLTTVLDDLRADMAEDGDIPLLPLAVPARPGYMVEYLPEFDYDLLKMWIKKAKPKGSKKDEEPHMLQLAYAILTHCCRAIYRNGKKLVNPSTGDAFTFTSGEFHRLQGLDLPSPRASIRKLYGRGSDGHILQTMRRVAEEAGYTDEIDLEIGETGPLDD